MDSDKAIIIDKFNSFVRGKRPNTSNFNLKHDGRGGHWLESQMGIVYNSSNTPDLLGYEMKNNTTSKTSFGDWSPSNKIWGRGKKLTQDDFLRIFGQANSAKNGRYSWSGTPSPRIGQWNTYGQRLEIDDNNNILAKYSYSKDQRLDKDTLIPNQYKKENLVICEWSSELMRRRVENKFNQKGWFKCVIGSDGRYSRIVFGGPITFERWIAYVKSKDIYFDSGMYEGNNRPYMMWRAGNRFWESLITSEY